MAITASQVRVVDPVLTTHARGYHHPQRVAMKLFPMVSVAQRGGKLVEFDRTDFQKFNTVRTPGSRTKRVVFGHAGEDYALVDHAIEGQVPDEWREEAMTVPGIDMGRRAVNGSQNIISLECEIEAADLATTASNYDNNHVVTLSGNKQWSDANADPTGDVKAGIAQIRKAIGVRPNVVVLGGAVFDAVSVHPNILDRIKHTSMASATPDLLATLWNVNEVVVGDAISVAADNATATDVWGDNVILAYTEVGGMNDFGMPSYGYKYQLMNYPIVEQPYREHNLKSWMYPVCDAYKNAIVGKDAGYLLKDVLA